MDKRAFSFGRVNEMRPCLFGIAIFLIMIFHSPVVLATYNVRFFKVFCNIGVEMFLVLSAIGLYRSRKNDRRLWPFYRKRIERTVLPLLPVVLVWFGYFDLLGGAGWRAFFADVTLLTFWTKGFRTEWFVALILVLYAVYPLLWRLRTARLGALWMWLLIAAFVLLNAVWARFSPVSYERTEIAFSRVPSFLLGLLAAPWCEEEKKAPRGTGAALLALFVVLFAFKFLHYLVKPWSRLINAPLGFLLTVLLAQLCAAAKDAPVLRSAERFFAFLGGFTLELYLLHEKVLYCLLRLGVPRIWRGTLVSALAIALAIPIAWCYSRVCACVRARLPRK